MDLPPAGHDPVLPQEVLHWLAPAPGRVIVDCTVGRAGHAALIAPALLPGGTLLALDADLRNLEYARQRLTPSLIPRCRLFHANFAELPEVLSQAGIACVDGILADLGVSTNQLLGEDYGLSFDNDAPLDMRLDPSAGPSASDVVNRLDEGALADLLFDLAQERFSRRIARRIVQARATGPIRTTGQLATLVRRAVGNARGRIDPATRTFLALRMYVNHEVPNLQRLLEAAPGLLRPGGRIVVISFHSTEDRVVKSAFRQAAGTGLLRILTPKPLVSSEVEAARNPRSRSAKLRAAEKPI
jgi:16S rRNA (cytosine1402-N4)-methyltransferase